MFEKALEILEKSDVKIDYIYNIELHFYKYVPLKGKSYIELPKEI